MNKWTDELVLGMEVVDEALPHSRSHSGGLVSPTDRPTISAMTASRISRAKARIMYFCRVKNRLLWHFQVVPRHWTLTSCITDICKVFFKFVMHNEKETHTLRDFFWYLTAFLVSSFALQIYSAALDTFFSMLFTISPCKWQNQGALN